MPEKYDFVTHYESGLGVALAGDIPKGTITIFKCSGDMERYYVTKGDLLENLREPYLCRTQIKVYLPDGADYYLHNPIGNHHLVCTGDETEEIIEFFKLLRQL